MIKVYVQMSPTFVEERNAEKREAVLPDGATLGDLGAELRCQSRGPKGTAIRPGEDHLTDRYSFNIDARFYFDETDHWLGSDKDIRRLTPACSE